MCSAHALLAPAGLASLCIRIQGGWDESTEFVSVPHVKCRILIVHVQYLLKHDILACMICA